MESMRIDKWLWAARFYKTRSLASDEIGKGRVHVNALEAKPAREVKAGDTIALRQGPMTRTVRVLALSEFDSPALNAFCRKAGAEDIFCKTKVDTEPASCFYHRACVAGLFQFFAIVAPPCRLAYQPG